MILLRESAFKQLVDIQCHFIFAFFQIPAFLNYRIFHIFIFKVFESEEQLAEERRTVEEMRKLLSKAEKRNRALESVLEDERKASEILHVRNEGLNAKLKKLRESVEASVSSTILHQQS